MIFTPVLLGKIVSGEKTVTRRIAKDNPRSPWWVGRCGYTVGRAYMACPGRAKPGVAQIRIVGVRLEPLGHLSEDEARLEGFAGPAEFEAAWSAINGGYDPGAPVWRVEFELCDEIET